MLEQSDASNTVTGKGECAIFTRICTKTHPPFEYLSPKGRAPGKHRNQRSRKDDETKRFYHNKNSPQDLPDFIARMITRHRPPKPPTQTQTSQLASPHAMNKAAALLHKTKTRLPYEYQRPKVEEPKVPTHLAGRAPRIRYMLYSHHASQQHTSWAVRHISDTCYTRITQAKPTAQVTKDAAIRGFLANYTAVKLAPSSAPI